MQFSGQDILFPIVKPEQALYHILNNGNVLIKLEYCHHMALSTC